MVSLFLGRHLSLGSDGRKSSPAIKVSVTAVALSLGVMLAAIAIVGGFKREIKEKIGGYNSQITLYVVPDSNTDDVNVVNMNPSLTELLEKQEDISDYSLQLSVPAIFKTPDDFKGIYLRSLNSAKTAAFVKRNLEEGIVPDFSKRENVHKIVISRIAARELGLKTGDKIETYFISDDVRARRLEVAGIFNTHFDTYDKVLAFGALGLMQNITGLSDKQGTSVQIETPYTDDEHITDAIINLNRTLTEATASGYLFREYRLDNIYNQGAAYFNWLSLLDTNVAVVLVLMIIVAVATLISGMLILILDKKHFIGIVRALGATCGTVRRVFVYLALKVAILGMIIGNAVMLTFLFCQNRWHLLPLDPEAYYIDFVPVELDFRSILLLNLSCFIIIYLSLILPSRYVSKIQPAEAMRANE